MYIFEITTPGTWLVSDNREWAWKIQNLLTSLTSQFIEANLALNLFTEAILTQHQQTDLEEWQLDNQRKREIEEKLAKEYGLEHCHNENIRFEAEIIFKREKWTAGCKAREFTHNLPFLYAKSFLYSLDSFDKFLNVIAAEEYTPKILSSLSSRLTEHFPDLRGVRNTVQHIEDRSRFLGAGRKPKNLDLKPISNSAIHAPNGGVLVLNQLNGTKYGSTKADGDYGEVDVSPESMEKLQSILQETLEAFPWHGPMQHHPNV